MNIQLFLDKIPVPQPDDAHNLVVDFGLDLQCQWVEGGQIFLLRVLKPSPTRQLVDVWTEVQRHVFTTYFSEKPIFILHELPPMSLTPYARHRIEALNKELSGREAYAAVVFEKSILRHLIRLFVEMELRRLNKRSTQRLFYTRDDALMWLREKLAETTPQESQ